MCITINTQYINTPMQFEANLNTSHCYKKKEQCDKSAIVCFSVACWSLFVSLSLLLSRQQQHFKVSNGRKSWLTLLHKNVQIQQINGVESHLFDFFVSAHSINLQPSRQRRSKFLYCCCFLSHVRLIYCWEWPKKGDIRWYSLPFYKPYMFIYEYIVENLDC